MSPLPRDADGSRARVPAPVRGLDRSWRSFRCAATAMGLCMACSGRASPDPGFSASQGELGAKPGGGSFVSDPHSGGRATRVRLEETSWGRLVDVYDVDATGARNPMPVL